jgi:hypothetical protein
VSWSPNAQRPFTFSALLIKADDTPVLLTNQRHRRPSSFAADHWNRLGNGLEKAGLGSAGN